MIALTKKYIEIESCFFKKKNKKGDWYDDPTRPAIIMSTKWSSIKFGVKHLDYVIDTLTKIRNTDEEGFEEEEEE